MNVPGKEDARAIGPLGLSRNLRLVGIAHLVLAGVSLFLGMTGYQTTRPVSLGHLIVGVGLAILGRSCLAAGRSFGEAAGAGPVPPALVEALGRTNRIFGTYLIILCLAILGLGTDAVSFAMKLLGRST